MIWILFSLWLCLNSSTSIQIPHSNQPTSPSSSFPSSSPSSLDSPSKCNLQIIHLNEGLTGEEKTISRLADIPILYKGFSSRNSVLRNFTKFENLNLNHGTVPVTLSSSNTYSHEKIQMTLKEYLERMNPLELEMETCPCDSGTESGTAGTGGTETETGTRIGTTSIKTVPVSSQQSANETYYLFGNNYGPLWSQFQELYQHPPYPSSQQAGAVTIGIGGRNSGVSFHYHGPGFIEMIHGSKLFFLYPPHQHDTQHYPHDTNTTSDSRFKFDPNMTQLEWYETVYPTLSSQLELEKEKDPQPPQQQQRLYECEIFPGDILYFPDRWYHGTLNRGLYNFFVSVFIDPQLI
jgi:hypothetical protein